MQKHRLCSSLWPHVLSGSSGSSSDFPRTTATPAAIAASSLAPDHCLILLFSLSLTRSACWCPFPTECKHLHFYMQTLSEFPGTRITTTFELMHSPAEQRAEGEMIAHVKPHAMRRKQWSWFWDERGDGSLISMETLHPLTYARGTSIN
jgi:hypothetical protein